MPSSKGSLGEVTAAKPERQSSSDPLSKIVSKRIVMPRKCLLYGTPGVGKTTYFSKFPNPIFVPTEEGVNDFDVAKFPVSTSYDQFLDNLMSLMNTSDYHTVVIDSLDWLEQLVWADVAAEHGVGSIGDIGYGKGWTYSADKFREVFDVCDRLRKTGKMVCTICHSAVRAAENPETDAYNQYTLALHKSVASMAIEWHDEVFFATYRVAVKKSDSFGPDRAVGGERIIRTTEKPFCQAKNRLRLDEEIDMNPVTYLKKIKG